MSWSSMCGAIEQDFRVTLFFEQKSFSIPRSSWQWWNMAGVEKTKAKERAKILKEKEKAKMRTASRKDYPDLVVKVQWT